jgi:hypothetical protein
MSQVACSPSINATDANAPHATVDPNSAELDSEQMTGFARHFAPPTRANCERDNNEQGFDFVYMPSDDQDDPDPMPCGAKVTNFIETTLVPLPQEMRRFAIWLAGQDAGDFFFFFYAVVLVAMRTDP